RNVKDYVRNAICRDLNVPAKKSTVHMPRDQMVGSRRNVAQQKRSIIRRTCMPMVWHHDDGSVHIRMQVTIHLCDAGLVEPDNSSVSFRIVAEVEFLRVGK